MNASELIKELASFEGKYDINEWWIFYEDKHLMHFMERNYPDVYDFVENALKTDKEYSVVFQESVPIAGITIKNKKPLLFLNPHRITHIKNLPGIISERDYPLNAYRFYIYILLHEALHVLLQNFRHLPLDNLDHYAKNIAQDMIIDNIIYIFSGGEWRNWSHIVPEINRQIEELGLVPHQKKITLNSQNIDTSKEKFILDFKDWELAMIIKMFLPSQELEKLAFDSIDIPSEGKKSPSKEGSAEKDDSDTRDESKDKTSASTEKKENSSERDSKEEKASNGDEDKGDKGTSSSQGKPDSTEKGKESKKEQSETKSDNKSLPNKEDQSSKDVGSKGTGENNQDSFSKNQKGERDSTSLPDKHSGHDEDSNYGDTESSPADDIDQEILNRIKANLQKRKEQNENRPFYNKKVSSNEKVLPEIELEAILERERNFYGLLRKYIKAVDYKQREYTWKKIHRKFPGIYPGYKLLKTPGEIAIIIDTSGSMFPYLTREIPECLSTIRRAIDAIEKNFGLVSKFFVATVSDHLHKGKFEEITKEQLRKLKIILGQSTDYSDLFKRLLKWKQHTSPPSRKNSPDIVIFITDLEVSLDFMLDSKKSVKSCYKKFSNKLIWILVGNSPNKKLPPIGEIFNFSGTPVSRGYYKAKGGY